MTFANPQLLLLLLAVVPMLWMLRKGRLSSGEDLPARNSGEDSGTGERYQHPYA